MIDDLNERIAARRPSAHPFDEKLRGLYQTLNDIKKVSQQSEADQSQQLDPAQMQMMQAQAQQAATAQYITQQNNILQQAMQAASQMDPLARHRMAMELRQNALAGLGGDQDYMLNNKALAAKDYPNAFGDVGKRVQQILLASGMLDGRPSTQDHYNYIKNYLT